MKGFFNRNFWKVAGIMAGIYAGTFAVSSAIGLTLPSTLSAKRTVWFAEPPARIWKTITDRTAQPAWHNELLSVSPIESIDGRPAWRETYWSHQKIDLEEVERSNGERRRQNAWVWDERAARLVLKGVEQNTPYKWVQYMRFQSLPVLEGGTRTIDVVASRGGSLVTVQEEKTIRVPPFRTWARLFVLPQLSGATIERYLAALGHKIGQPARPV
ncbi:hypothetical protein [Gloeobacter morelensis]|uniref:Cyclase/dehydrase n=1 Tax=Gloeobacter morelensis MG652769 TaxID=2781736 RepID=A0ABY3PRI5_9CYAN|nr:hypothetical protein [Gloeobacter morelensis]UFP96317.1 hypothetical protein ISF26_08950 [Gloeobacter morelensis MG652769]